MSNVELNNKFLSAWDIDVSIRSYSLGFILESIKYDEINLYPEFQRNIEWDNTKKSRLIESLLIRFPLPFFYFSQTREGTYDVIDGLHRLLTFKSFINNEFSLKNLEYFNDLTELRYNDLSIKFQRRILESTLNVYVIESATPQNILKNLFVRLNTTATIFNENEIRHILHFSESQSFIYEIINSEIFKLTIQFPNKRLIHEELVLRFVGFYYFLDDFKTSLNNFLDFTIIKTNEFDYFKKHEIIKKILNSLKILYEIFKDNVFKKNDSGKQILSLFETWTICIAKKNEHELDLIINEKEKLKKLYSEQFNNKIFIDLITKQTTRKLIILRLESIENLIKKIL